MEGRGGVGGIRVVDAHLVTELLDEIHTLDIMQIWEAFGYQAEWAHVQWCPNIDAGGNFGYAISCSNLA